MSDKIRILCKSSSINGISNSRRQSVGKTMLKERGYKPTKQRLIRHEMKVHSKQKGTLALDFRVILNEATVGCFVPSRTLILTLQVWRYSCHARFAPMGKIGSLYPASDYCGNKCRPSKTLIQR
jgi:hypothetical protein